MIKSGARPLKFQHKANDYLKSFHPKLAMGLHSLSAELMEKTGAAQFPPEYLCDVGGNKHNQNIDDYSFDPVVTEQPEGCTNFATAGLATDLTNGATVFRPDDLEAVTHANARGGLDARTSMQIAMDKLGWFADIFDVIAGAGLDYFDTFRLAIFSGAPERRSISATFPWFPSWEQAALMGTFLMPMPTEQELAQLAANPKVFSWHEPKVDGWTTTPTGLVLRAESWQGTDCGVNGYIGYDRATINTVLAIRGTGGLTGTRMGIGNPQPVDATFMQWISSWIRNLMPYSY